ncbi:hypothetical protein HID58_086411 [Brassica napus]|uniref:Uncharacterized protein n=1 Tax=Brassica napus TaxID=3708 RepID=A0ABQ7XTA4_BRANA|nr:hypothetical protein HID58_086411 [Brassica napus]
MKSTSQTHLGCNLLPTKRLRTSHIYGLDQTNDSVIGDMQSHRSLVLCAKRQKMLEDMEKDFEGGQEADKFDGGGGSKSSGSLDIRFRVEKVQSPLCDWKMATLEFSL